MQFSVLALLSLVAVALAVPVELSARQSTQTQPNGEDAAMSTQSGDVVSFESSGVYQAASNGDFA